MISLARRGLDALKALPDTPERAAKELALLITLGGVADRDEGLRRRCVVILQVPGSISTARVRIARTGPLFSSDMKAEAREMLAAIYGWFTEGFDTPDLQEAKALLDELA